MEKRNLTPFFNRMVHWIVPILGAAAAIFVLFIPPMPGVADQGDFQRIMDIAGLAETEKSLAESESRFYQYVKAEYGMTPVNPFRVLGFIPSSSMIYPILLSKFICKVAGLTYFNTGILAAVYTAVYIAAIWICLRWMGFARRPVYVFACFAVLMVLLDGNYFVWFNSLYGEPMMMIGLLLFTASALYAIQSETLSIKNILFLFIASFVFLGSKNQCITALPLIVYMQFRLVSARNNPEYCRHNRLWLKHPPVNGAIRYTRSAMASPRVILKLAVPLVLLIAYTIGIYSQQNKTCGVDTKYNAVFYGILKNSGDPVKDLEMLGLSGDMAVEAGKHAYLPHNEYVRYVPWSEITCNEFNSKINNFKLIRFYLVNPRRLLEGMKYTASQSFQTGTFLGKYEKADVPVYTYVFNRFTLWSDFRSLLPKKLWFIVLAYLAAFLISVIEYRRQNVVSRLRIELLWVLLGIGVFQFPMPFVGNGEADTAKQLFLFNYTFDILVIAASIWAFNKLFFSNADV